MNRKNIKSFNILSTKSRKIAIGSIFASSILLFSFYPTTVAHATTMNKTKNTIATTTTKSNLNVEINNSVVPTTNQTSYYNLEPKYTATSNITGIPNFTTDYTTYNLTYIFGGIALLNNKNSIDINENDYYVSVNNSEQYNLDLSDGADASATTDLNKLSLNIVNNAISNGFSNSNYTIYSGTQILNMIKNGQALPNINGIIHQGPLTAQAISTTGWAGDSTMGPQISNVIVGISNVNYPTYFAENFQNLTNANSDTLFTNNQGSYDFVLGSYGALDNMNSGSYFPDLFQNLVQKRGTITDNGTLETSGTYLTASPSIESLGAFSLITPQSYKNGFPIGISLGNYLEWEGLNNNYLILNISSNTVSKQNTEITFNYINTNNEVTKETIPLSNFTDMGNGTYSYKLSNIKDFNHFTNNNSSSCDITANLKFTGNFPQSSSNSLTVSTTITSDANGSSSVANAMVSANNKTFNQTFNTYLSPTSFSYI